MSRPLFLGLDIECTGSDVDKHAIIQIGIACRHEGRIVWQAWDIGQQEYVWEQEALNVNKFTHERIKMGHPVESVDAYAASEIEKWRDGRSAIAVGWNVAGFDIPFIKKAMPLTYDKLSYRTVDLNAIIFAASLAGYGAYDKMKRRAKGYAEATLPAVNWHDAGYDAAAGLASLEYLVNEIGSKVWDGY